MRRNKFIILLLALILCVVGCFTGCDKDTGNGENPIVTTESYLVKNSITYYKIVIPTTAGTDLKWAANDMSKLFEEITGAEISVITDDQVENVKGKYLSIGKTCIFEASNAEKEFNLDYNYLNKDGFYIRNYGDAMVMVGRSDISSGYAGYEFFAKQFNLEFYTQDVYTYDSATTAKLISLDYIDIPDIGTRTGGTAFNSNWDAAYSRGGNSKSYFRYRMTSQTDGCGVYGHSQNTIMPWSSYQADNPMWYSSSSILGTGTTQWAMEDNANDEGVLLSDKVAELLYENYIFKAGDVSNNVYYAICQEDNFLSMSYDVEKYNQLVAENSGTLGGGAAAVYIIFMNKVAKKIAKWVEEELPLREVVLFMFGYQQTQSPPVKYENGEYVAYNDNVVCEPNVAVMVAPLNNEIVASHSYFNKDVNEQTYRAFYGWSAVCQNMMVWQYSTDFGDFQCPFNIYSSYGENYRYYKTINMVYLYDQGCLIDVPNYLELKQYLTGKLSWDSTLSTEELIYNFFKAVYGEGFDEMYEYFNLVRTRMTAMEAEGVYTYYHTGDQTSTQRDYYINNGMFSRYFFDKCEALAQTALEKVRAAGNTSAETFIRRDMCPLRYVCLSDDSIVKTFSTEEYLSLINEFYDFVVGELGLSRYQEAGGNLYSDLYDTWLSKVQ